MIAAVIYPLFLPKFWKLIYFLSGFIILTTLFLDAEEEINWIPTGSVK
jgi:hypothetical protein